jgi:WD repeat-containing protein 19
LQDENGQIPIWELSTQKVQHLETNLRDPTFLKWSKTSSQLAIGTQKVSLPLAFLTLGISESAPHPSPSALILTPPPFLLLIATTTLQGNLLIFNKATKKKIPVLAKHPRAITCGAWSKKNQLCLGSDDCTMTLSNEVGDTLEQTDVKFPPHDLQFATQSNSTNGKDENTVSINMGGKSLLLYNLDNPDNPVELSFEPDYGNIVSHCWTGEDGMLIVGFSRGQVVAMSTHADEVAEELFSRDVHNSSLFGMAYSPALRRGATAGDGGIKIIDLTNNFEELKGEAINMDTSEDGRPHMINWSPDGTILTVSTKSGYVYNFLAKMPMIFSHYNTNIAYLSSLCEISVVDTVSRSRPLTVTVDIEPTFNALGANHVAVGMNNRILYYRCVAGDTEKVGEQEYLGTVAKVCLNDRFAAVLSDSQVTLHLIEPVKVREKSASMTLPCMFSSLLFKHSKP